MHDSVIWKGDYLFLHEVVVYNTGLMRMHFKDAPKGYTNLLIIIYLQCCRMMIIDLDFFIQASETTWYNRTLFSVLKHYAITNNHRRLSLSSRIGTGTGWHRKHRYVTHGDLGADVSSPLRTWSQQSRPEHHDKAFASWVPTGFFQGVQTQRLVRRWRAYL